MKELFKTFKSWIKYRRQFHMQFSESAFPSKAKFWSIVQWIRVQKKETPLKMHKQAYELKGDWHWWLIISKTGKSLPFWALHCGKSRYRRHNKIVRTVHSPTDAHLLELWLKFTLKLYGSYIFRSTTIIRELASEPG